MITKELMIEKIFEMYPSKSQRLAQELTNSGLSCVGCGASTYETLEMGMAGHGFSEEQIDAMVKRLNEIALQEVDESTISMTKRAAEKFLLICESENKKGYGLIFADKPGGCSGFEYHLDFGKNPKESDEVFESHGVRIFVDKNSLSRLLGSEIDYLDGLHGSGFKIINPNVKGSCSCGNSQAY